MESSNNVGNSSYAMGGGGGGRSLERPAFWGPRHPPWFQVVGSRGLGSCHALLCFVAHAGGGGGGPSHKTLDLETHPRPRGPQGLGLQALSPAQQLQGGRLSGGESGGWAPLVWPGVRPVLTAGTWHSVGVGGGL